MPSLHGLSSVLSLPRKRSISARSFRAEKNNGNDKVYLNNSEMALLGSNVQWAIAKVIDDVRLNLITNKDLWQPPCPETVVYSNRRYVNDI